MSETSERYQRLAAELTAKVEAVAPDQWSSPTPCEDWTARDLIGHMVDTSRMFLGFVGVELPAAPGAGDDPVAAWTSARDAVQAALDDPDVAERSYEGAFGSSTFEEGVGRWICIDLVVHGWDLARATGQNERIDPAEARRVYEALAPMDEMMRGPQAFGPKLEPPDGADEQARVLAFLGRQP
jgi:uncharacterized protein (TIGR03086 family)